jgi:hypothetical protein
MNTIEETKKHKDHAELLFRNCELAYENGTNEDEEKAIREYEEYISLLGYDPLDI